ncbi:hypothetical protein HX858_08345 [Marine Group I thaumarchaeote]|uniref:Lipoprotein n=1 Tax=Marine Group I thaumarchaeote TaxID=2511932 RepID=A0A7K4MY44_9ARCH|nr:hypothetical protein [Marine Group I thaumarchaeote]
MKTALLILVMLFLSSCSTKSNNWPSGMTPFFAECEGEGGIYTDKEYAKRNSGLVTEAGNIMTEANQL